MIGAVLWAMIVIAGAAPIVSALVGMRLRSSIVISLVPGVILALGTLVSLATAWGGRTASGSDDVTNTGALLVAAVLTLMAGALGDCIAGVVTRVRSGNRWSRGA